jgi:hypothetical protein
MGCAPRQNGFDNTLATRTFMRTQLSILGVVVVLSILGGAVVIAVVGTGLLVLYLQSNPKTQTAQNPPTVASPIQPPTVPPPTLPPPTQPAFVPPPTQPPVTTHPVAQPPVATEPAPAPKTRNDETYLVLSELDKKLEAYHQLIKPQTGEWRFAEVPWERTVWDARQKAAEQGKPIFVWYMAGEPLGQC